jgi:hypothetical protein
MLLEDDDFTLRVLPEMDIICVLVAAVVVCLRPRFICDDVRQIKWPYLSNDSDGVS